MKNCLITILVAWLCVVYGNSLPNSNKLVVDHDAFLANYETISNEIDPSNNGHSELKTMRDLHLYPIYYEIKKNLTDDFFKLIKKTSLGNHTSPFEMFEAFIKKFGKIYKTEMQKVKRFKIFLENAKYIALHNLEYLAGRVTYNLDFNPYADWTHSEFRRLNGLRPELSRRLKGNMGSNNNAIPSHILVTKQDEIPDEIDWRIQGAVTPVKNQGECGSCWAFSATGALEAQNYLKASHRKLISLSEQNLVDCSQKYGNEGCNGGLMDNAFEYINMNHGIDTEESYPYMGKDGKKCLFNRKKVGAIDYGFVDLPTGNERLLQLALARVGPVSIGIDASHMSFQFYRSGIYETIHCSNTSLDHGVLAVGYGEELDGKYWLVKNSWGPEWGDEGYIKMARGKDNMCGVATQASLPIEKTID